MELREVSSTVNIGQESVKIDRIGLNDSDVFGSGENGLPCFQFLLKTKKEDLVGCIAISVNDAIELKNKINAFLDKIKCGIQPQNIDNRYQEEK